MSGRRVVAALMMMVGAVLISVLPGSPPASAAADGASSDSAMTLSGNGGFANLQVTVSQTKNLINQVVTVSWKGGVPTVPANGQFGTNYLQIMQCWGDDPGPDRTQCQFGGGVGTTIGAGNWVRNRQITYPFVDQKEMLKAPAGVPYVYVPFWAAGKDRPEGPAPSGRSDYFDAQVTNEVPFARTHSDGTGEEFFEIQTVRQAAGLGCGDLVATSGTATARKCWLVVVPRGSTEVDGTPRTGQVGNYLDSSPLSESNWENRIFFPLEFQPVGQACPIGSPERRMIGHEFATDAVSHWQPALCVGGGALYSYTQLSDDVTRSQVMDGSAPGLALVTNPIPPDQVPPDHPLVYAPVGLSALTIAFNIERQPSGSSSEADQNLSGERFTSMKLNPRLVAKLLTQSYQLAVLVRPDYLKHNPFGLTVDPEFLELNPDYQGFASSTKPPDALVQLGNSDLTSLLWSWVQADPDARAFLSGTPDKFGMVVNENNKGLVLPASSFPRNDQGCLDIAIGPATGKYCTLDAHPFTNDMHDSGRSAGRGDTQARLVALGDDNTIVTKKADRQIPGNRAVLAVVDAATATRYGLPTASLENAAGQFVTPTTDSLLAAEKAMKPSAASGVLAADPSATDPAAYPLTALSYAVTAPSTLDAAARKDYAAFLRYAAGPGQQPGLAPGQLPLGMAPLPEVLKAQTAAAAAAIEAQAASTPGGPLEQPQVSPAAGPGSTAADNSGSTGAPGTTTGTPGTGGGGASVLVTPVPSPGPGGSAVPSPGAISQPAGVRRRTPSLPAPAWIGSLLLVVLICGALAATSSPVLGSPALRRLVAAIQRRVRKGVMPTER